MTFSVGTVRDTSAHPPINPQFKLVFLTAVGGTALFIVLCLVLSLIAGKTPPPLFEKVIMGFFDMAKVGFGALVGLLGGKKPRDQVHRLVTPRASKVLDENLRVTRTWYAPKLLVSSIRVLRIRLTWLARHSSN
jgi:hypothetical protein